MRRTSTGNFFHAAMRNRCLFVLFVDAHIFRVRQSYVPPAKYSYGAVHGTKKKETIERMRMRRTVRNHGLSCFETFILLFYRLLSVSGDIRSD